MDTVMKRLRSNAISPEFFLARTAPGHVSSGTEYWVVDINRKKRTLMFLHVGLFQ